MNEDGLPPIEWIRQLFAAAEEFHVERLKMDHFEVHFREGDEPRLTATVDRLERAKLGEKHGMPTEDEFLFMSAPDGAPARDAGPPA